ncbi:MAG: DUF4249 family protein [Ignavibacteria bacterium]|jgi:hypothetical protein|nr:DUF4249 family protein [Ignavibacteria bacterium]MCU7501597.1 DUF4249 family protein [Ignavibacteria bacterium]MCU7517134.1 DUF4249 family protein [Ignavibacteria bacterium]
MKIKIIKVFAIALLLSLSAFISCGCEQTETLEPDSIFKEKTVVFASLEKDSLFNGVTFTRTLPLNEPYDIKKAELKDVTAYLKINGIQVIPLIYDKNGVYKPGNKLYVEPETTYELFADWEGKSIYAITRVPGVPEVTGALIVDGKYVEAKINPKGNETYGAAWFITGANEFRISGLSADFFEVYGAPSLPPSSVSLRTTDIPEEYRTDLYAKRTYVKVFAFDKSFYDYFKTRANNQQVHNSFTQGGSNIIWNVYGNDVIGLFIGNAAGKLIRPN